MECESLKSKASKRINDARLRIQFESPFYRKLLLKLDFTLASCGTAATDMNRVIMDPEFVDKLTDDEIIFIIKHEVLHCCLQHCIRNKDKNKRIYNIAADIVVNSTLMNDMNDYHFKVAGKEPMHKAPNGVEGHRFTADEVYAILVEEYDNSQNTITANKKKLDKDYGTTIDDHEIWDVLPEDDVLSHEWNKALAESFEGEMRLGCSNTILRQLEEGRGALRIDWKSALREFISCVNDRCDYMFSPPDRRFSDSEFILPSFVELENSKVEKLWFLIDASGSISSKLLAEAYQEVKEATKQIENLSGKLSFFDTEVTKPIEFECIEDLNQNKIQAGGGTSFYAIFKYLKDKMVDDLPRAIVIITDGYADYPKEEAALGIPVLWIIVNNNKDAKFGRSIHVSCKNNLFGDF